MSTQKGQVEHNELSSIKRVYQAELNGEVVEWRVNRRTPKTLSVAHPNQYSRTVRASDLGVQWHLTPMGALHAMRVHHEREIKWLKERLHLKRSMLGMVLSQLERTSKVADAPDR